MSIYNSRYIKKCNGKYTKKDIITIWKIVNREKSKIGLDQL